MQPYELFEEIWMPVYLYIGKKGKMDCWAAFTGKVLILLPQKFW